MLNLAIGEGDTACPEKVEDRRADCEIHHRAYDLEQETVDEEQRRARIAGSSDARP